MRVSMVISLLLPTLLSKGTTIAKIVDVDTFITLSLEHKS